MPMLIKTWITNKEHLLEAGIQRMEAFCKANSIAVPKVMPEYEGGAWHFDACAYYRPTTIYISVGKCAMVAKDGQVRNWNWPGSTTDRTPYGVICHELGHHCDVVASSEKHSYSGNYSRDMFRSAMESPITGYAPNPAEWFAEMFRLFVTNAGLLKAIRPRTYDLLCKCWKPVSNPNWIQELGSNVLPRIVKAMKNKVV